MSSAYGVQFPHADFSTESGQYVNSNGISGAAKRLLDLMIALPAFIVLSPVLLIVSLLIYWQDGAAPIFRQKRLGHAGHVFDCFKLRTMVPDAAERLQRLLEEDPEAADEWARDQKLRNDPRVTALGSFLRKTSLDELPQLINVIRGEMSIVGPRPIVRNEIAKYGELFDYYAAARPGITGLWQVSGRSDISYDARVALDTRYVREWTLVNDLWIIVKTIPLVLLRRGAC